MPCVKDLTSAAGTPGNGDVLLYIPKKGHRAKADRPAAVTFTVDSQTDQMDASFIKYLNMYT